MKDNLKNNEEENIPHMDIINKNFQSFSRSEQIRHLEVEGYLVIPKILNQNQVSDVKSEMSNAEMGHKDYSVKQKIISKATSVA